VANPGFHIVPQVSTAAGEVTAGFDEFFEREKVPLFRALCLVTRNPSEAEELTQDAFVRVFERWDRVSKLMDPTGYLYRTAMNAFRSWRRRAVLAARYGLRPPTPDDRTLDIDSQDAVMRALAPLPPRQRAAVVLMDLLGYSSKEAASMLGIRAATVRTHAAKAHAELKKWMVTHE
jgi:RNA polymerase sigma factor (sigma-70 family)